MNKKKQIIELDKLEPIDDLDEEELAIHESLIAGDYVSIANNITKDKYATIFKESHKRSKSISLRLQENDYVGIKSKALELGMPYQSLINSLIHQFLSGELKSRNGILK